MNLNSDLHSTMVLFKLFSDSMQRLARGFTFHYGSIQISEYLDNTYINFKFTFHYGSIQIKAF